MKLQRVEEAMLISGYNVNHSDSLFRHHCRNKRMYKKHHVLMRSLFYIYEVSKHVIFKADIVGERCKQLQRHNLSGQRPINTVGDMGFPGCKRLS